MTYEEYTYYINHLFLQKMADSAYRFKCSKTTTDALTVI